MKNAAVSTLLLVLAAAAAAVMLVLGGFGMMQIGSMHTSSAATLEAIEHNSLVLRNTLEAQGHFELQIKEYKNILLRGNAAESYDKHLGKFNAEAERTQAILKEVIAAHADDPEHAQMLETLRQSHAQTTAAYLEGLKSFDRDNPEAGRLVDQSVKGQDDDTRKLFVTAAERTSKEMTESVDIVAADRVLADSRIVFSVVVLLGLAISVGLVLFIRKSLMDRLGGEPAYAVGIAQRIAGGDLGMDIALRPGDSSSLLATMKAMVEGLRDIVGKVRHVSGQVSQSSRQLAGNSNRVAASSDRQSESAASMAATVEELTVSIDQISDNTRIALESVLQSGELTDRGAHIVQQAVSEMEKIASAVTESSQLIQRLGDQSREISTITHTIQDIADQTNLLALNAAIEAARAGEQGRGFAVVADEVRKLAERTSQSTKEITRMIDAIQAGTHHAVSSMDRGKDLMETGVRLAREAGASMHDIKTGIGSVVGAVRETSASLDQQSTAGKEMAVSVERVAGAAEENSMAVTQIAASAGQLESLATELENSTARFNL